MHFLFSGGDEPRCAGQLQSCFAECVLQLHFPRITKAVYINAYSACNNVAFKITRTPKLLCVRHQMVQRSLGLVVRF